MRPTKKVERVHVPAADAHAHAHFTALGLAHLLGEEIELDAQTLQQHVREYVRRNPAVSSSKAYWHTVARLVKLRQDAPKAAVAPNAIAVPKRTLHLIFWGIVLIGLLFFLCVRGHAQQLILQDGSGNNLATYNLNPSQPVALRAGTNTTFTINGRLIVMSSAGGGGGGAPGGLNGQLQYNNASAFGGITNMTSDGTNVTKLTGTTGTFDFSAVGLMKFRFSAGATTSTNGDQAYDTTAKIWHIWQNAADKFLIASSNLGTSGQPCLSNADGSCTFADPIVSQATASLLNAQVVGNVASGAADSGNPVKTGGVFNTTQPTVTNGQRVDSQSTARGAVIVAPGVDGFAVTSADGGIVTLGAKTDAKTTSTDSTSVSIMSVLKEISEKEQNPASRAVTNAGTFAVQDTLQAGSALAGEIVPVTTATTTDTALRCILVSAASTNATNCKGSAGNVYGYRFINTTTTVYYLRMYNASSSPTCSSATNFVESIPIPPAAAAGGAGGIVSMEAFGEGYTTGISFCFTGGSSSTDNTNAAVGVFGTILYK